MFEGREYKQKGGYRDNAIRFADADGGVATTAYSYSMSAEESMRWLGALLPRLILHGI